MIVATWLMVSLVFFIRGQMVNCYAIFPRTMNSLHLGTHRPDRSNQHLEMDDESSGMMPECNGEMTQHFSPQLPDLSGCFNFQTPGFNDGGYPNYTGSDSNMYICSYTFQFGAVVTGMVTFKKAGFEFQAPTLRCSDAIGATPVMRNISDPEDMGQGGNYASFCGVISEDKTLRFSSSSLTFLLLADATVNGNGAEIQTCFD